MTTLQEKSIVVYKTKIGYYLKWLTEGFRTRRWHRIEVKKNYKTLIEKYNSEGKTVNFLKKYSGNEQILNLKSLSN